MKAFCVILTCGLSVLFVHSTPVFNSIPESFATIAAKNAFRLSPPQPPAIEVPAPPSRARVFFQGITTILGRTQALLTIQSQHGPSGLLSTSYVLGLGDSQSDVIVMEINVKRGTVRVNNLGVEQTLILEP